MKVDPSKINLAEKDIEDWLYENPTKVDLGFGRSIKKWIGRQVQVPSGRIDLLGILEYSGHIAFVVTEVKNTEFTQSAILQVSRYAADIESVANDYSCRTDNRISDHVMKLVIARGSPSDQLLQEAESINVWLTSFNVNFDLSISGRWRFKSDVYSEQKNKLDKLSETKMFTQLLDDDIPDSIKDFIESIPDEEED
jgi:hypothetical protein